MRTRRSPPSKKQSDDPEKEARLFALRQLNYRPLNTAKLRSKLKEREFSEDIISTTIEEMTRLGYLNDLEWAEASLRGEIRKGRSVIYIKAK